MVPLIQLFDLLMVADWPRPHLLELAPQTRHSARSGFHFLGRYWALAPHARRSDLTLKIRMGQESGYCGHRLQHLSFGQNFPRIIEVRFLHLFAHLSLPYHSRNRHPHRYQWFCCIGPYRG